MESKIKYILIGVLIVILILVVACGVIVFLNSGNAGISSDNIDPSSLGKMVIKVHADDPVNGKITVYELNDITPNNDKTINQSQITGTYDIKGNKQDVSIENGEATYTVTDGTQFIYIYPYVTELSNFYDYGNSGKYVTVDVYINGVKKFSSKSQMYADQADITFGDKVISKDGTAYDVIFDQTGTQTDSEI